MHCAGILLLLLGAPVVADCWGLRCVSSAHHAAENVFAVRAVVVFGCLLAACWHSGLEMGLCGRLALDVLDGDGVKDLQVPRADPRLPFLGAP